MFQEFKTFIARGNVIDLAVGVIIGAAFGKITSSLVADIIMPPLSLILGKVDFTNRFIAFDGKDYPTLAAAKTAGVATLNYGTFFNVVVEFFIVAFAVFMIVKLVNKVHKGPEAATKDCAFCAMAIPLAAKRCGHCTTDFSAPNVTAKA